MKRFVALSLVCACALSCSDFDNADVAERSSPIYGGTPADPILHAAVAGIHGVTEDLQSVYITPFCTGTLVAESDDVSIILTAAHCLDSAAEGVAAKKAERMVVYFGENAQVDLTTHIYDVCQVKIHPSYDTKWSGTHDVGLLKIRGRIAEADPALIVRRADRPKVGDWISHVGFGRTPQGLGSAKLQVETDIYRTDDFHIEYFQDQGGPCNGDSGGPQFVTRRDAESGADVLYLAGSTSYGDANCTSWGVSMRADRYRKWIGRFAATPCG